MFDFQQLRAGRPLVARLLCAVAVIAAIQSPIQAHAANDLGSTYTVQDGDTLGNIADRTGVPIEVIVSLNHLTDADTIFAGNVLRLPDAIEPIRGAVPAAVVTAQPVVTLRGTASAAPPAAPAQLARPIQSAGQAPGSSPVQPVAQVPVSTPILPVAQAPAATLVSIPLAARTSTVSAPISQRPISLSSLSSSTTSGVATNSVGQVQAAALLGSHSTRPAAVAIALQFAGSPYQFGGTGPTGFDCSGYVQFVETLAGHSLPRDLLGQYMSGSHPAPTALQPGDIVFFQDTYEPGLSHNGIYIGDGQFIHAIDEIRGVSLSSLSESYYSDHWYGATRL